MNNRLGGGRRQVTQRQAGLEETVEAVLEAHSAGSPTDETVRWTEFKPVQFAQQLLARGCQVSRNTAAKLLAGAGYRRRSLRKELITGPIDGHERDQQFRYIDTLRRQAQARGVPVLCVDTKRKEVLGHRHRRGQCYSTDVQFAYDHDYRHLTTGVLAPHGVYDYHGNVGFITLGTSRETSAFVCDAIALAWQTDRAQRYPHAAEILLTFDAGGANAARSLRFKEDHDGAGPPLGSALAGGPLPAVYLQVASHRAPLVLSRRAQLKRRHPRFGSYHPGSHPAHAYPTGLTVTARILETVYELG